MTSPLKRLDYLILALKKSSEKRVYEVVSNFEEAVTLSTFLGRSEDSIRLIQAYSIYFHNPIPYEIEFFCIFQQGVLLWLSGDIEAAVYQYNKCMAIAENQGDLHSKARSLMATGVLSTAKSKYPEALALMEKAETGLRTRGGTLLARCLNWLGLICDHMELFQRAWSYYSEPLELNEELALKGNQGYVLRNMGLLCQRMGFDKQAEGCYRDSMKIQEETGNNYGLADSMANLGMLLLRKRQLFKEAETLLEKSAEMHLEKMIFPVRVFCLPTRL